MSEFAAMISRRVVPCEVTDATAEQGRRGLGRRRHGTGTLAGTRVGARVTITGVGGELHPAAVRRLVDLGFAPGTTVEVLRRAPLGDPTVFRVADTEIALRRRHAQAVRVTPVADTASVVEGCADTDSDTDSDAASLVA